MRVVDPDLQIALNSRASQISILWTIVRTDGQVVRLTDCDVDLVVFDEMYRSSPGASPRNVDLLSTLAPSNSEVEAILDSPYVDELDLKTGRYDYASVEMAAFDRESGAPPLILLSGTLGEIQIREGVFTAEIRGVANRLRLNLVESYSPTCRADLGDSRCRIPIKPNEIARSTAYARETFVRVIVAGIYSDSRKYGDLIFECTTSGTTAGVQPVYSQVVGNTTTDGTAVFTTRQAWTRTSQVSAVIDDKVFRSTEVTGLTSGHFSLGVLTWESGANAGFSEDVKFYQATLTHKEWTMFVKPRFAVQVGDRFAVSPGCDKRVTTCITKYQNVLNFRGEPFIPGVDYLLDYPR